MTEEQLIDLILSAKTETQMSLVDTELTLYKADNELTLPLIQALEAMETLRTLEQ